MQEIKRECSSEELQLSDRSFLTSIAPRDLLKKREELALKKRKLSRPLLAIWRLTAGDLSVRSQSFLAGPSLGIFDSSLSKKEKNVRLCKIKRYILQEYRRDNSIFSSGEDLISYSKKISVELLANILGN